MDLVTSFSIKKNIRNPFIRDMLVVFIENMITKGLNFLIILFLINRFSPAEYGQFSVIYIFISVICAIIDLGMDNTVIRFSSKFHDHQKTIFGLYFIVKFLFTLFVIIIIGTLGKSIFHLINRDVLTSFLPIILTGIAIESIIFLNDTYFQSKEKFVFRSLINIVRNAASLLLVFVFSLRNTITVYQVLVLFYIPPLCISLVFVWRYIIYTVEVIKNKISRQIIADLFSYQKWMVLLSLFNTLLQRLDFFIISAMVSLADVGKYNAAFQLATVALLLPQAVGKVMLPKLSAFSVPNLSTFIKKSIRPITVLSILMIFLIPFSHPVTRFLFGNKYEGSSSILNVFLLAFIFILIGTPFEQSLYAMGKNNFVVFGVLIQIIIVSVCCPIFIKLIGIAGAAYAVALSRGAYSVYLIISTKKNIIINKRGEL